ncbi:MAG: AAA family ATPase [Candidatus Omnitrophica bacterium]|nr:AAA family ATPase [Candidatus Omnitrophota bacterium]
MEKIELNQEFKKALDLIENTAQNVFITGKAGTGKSTFLEYFRSTTNKKVAVLAPTGVAALNVGGQTIHSFFKFKPDITLQKIKKKSNKKIYKKIDIIIIDEVSMVRADLLDCIDKFLRLNGKSSQLSFGGTQMVFIGDLYQLPPVVTGKEREMFRTYYKSVYFFDAKVFDAFPMEFIEFEKVYRQKDKQFIDLLNKIRNNSVTDKELGLLNQRVGAEFESNKKSKYSIYLTTTNKMASQINEQYLNELKTRSYSYKAIVEGNFEQKYFPTDRNLRIKSDSQIMLLNNDASKRWVNGTIGKIIDVKSKKKEQDIIIVKLSNGAIEEVSPHKWEIFHFRLNEKTHKLETEVVGYFIQYPMKLAWAMTIHKSQGKTFDMAIIDVGRGTFAHGQMYVALSRCISLDGIVLKQPIQKRHILMDWQVVRFMTKYQYNLSEKSISLEEKIGLIKQAIENKIFLEIVYLKSNDEKSKRTIKPCNVGEKTYLNKPFMGVEGFCLKRKSERVFRVDRILKMRLVKKSA